jgi:hypothetical protein
MSSTDSEQFRDDDEIMSKDIDFLVQMLHEYTESLRMRADALESLRMANLAFATPTILVAGIFGPPEVVESIRTFASTRSILTVILWGMAVLAIVGLAVAFQRRRSRVRDEVHRLGEILFTLTQRASQFRDHGQISYAQKIAIDVRLADAESLLRRVKSVGWTRRASQVLAVRTAASQGL